MGRSWDEYPRDTTTLDAIDRNSVDYFIEKGIASTHNRHDEYYHRALSAPTPPWTHRL